MREGLGGTLDNGLLFLLTVESQAVCRRAGGWALTPADRGAPEHHEDSAGVGGPESQTLAGGKCLDNKASIKA